MCIRDSSTASQSATFGAHEVHPAAAALTQLSGQDGPHIHGSHAFNTSHQEALLSQLRASMPPRSHVVTGAAERSSSAAQQLSEKSAQDQQHRESHSTHCGDQVTVTTSCDAVRGSGSVPAAQHAHHAQHWQMPREGDLLPLAHHQHGCAPHNGQAAACVQATCAPEPQRMQTPPSRLPRECGGGQPAQPMRCLLYTSPSPRDRTRSRMPSSA